MKKTEIRSLAEHFIKNTLKVQPGERTWIEYQGALGHKIALLAAETVMNIGANPFLVDAGSRAVQTILDKSSDKDLERLGYDRLAIMKTMDTFLRIKDDHDVAKIDAPLAQKKKLASALKPSLNERVENTRWTLIAAPTAEFAKACGMNKTDFEAYYLKACLLDYDHMAQAVKPLQKIMREGKKVHIKGKNTNLTFSMEGIDAQPCVGTHNVPDGECFSAPIKNSVNGTITFGPSQYAGNKFDSMHLTFKDGKIIKATGPTDQQTSDLNEILDTDQGARYIGEFAIAFNPVINDPIGTILFDEKINGSLHLAMGECYEETNNGNKSDIHWDMVHIQRPEYGGGEIWIDDTLIRKDGIFVAEELKGLNPESLRP